VPGSCSILTYCTVLFFSLCTRLQRVGLKIRFFSLQKCVDKDPARRWSCEQLLRHSYFDNFHFKMPESELEEFEKLRRLRDRSRVSRNKDCQKLHRMFYLCILKETKSAFLMASIRRWKSTQKSSCLRQKSRNKF
jgi:serine/threonine protein kinase